MIDTVDLAFEAYQAASTTHNNMIGTQRESALAVYRIVYDAAIADGEDKLNAENSGINVYYDVTNLFQKNIDEYKKNYVDTTWKTLKEKYDDDQFKKAGKTC